MEESRVLKYLRQGRENARTRQELCILTGYSDRAVRNEIEELRRNGHIIINNQDGKGYYLTDSLVEIERQYKQNRSRAMSILVQQKYLRSRLKAAGKEINEGK